MVLQDLLSWLDCHHLWGCPAFLTQKWWDGPWLVGSLACQTKGPSWLLAPSSLALAAPCDTQLLVIHSVVSLRSLCHPERTICLQISHLSSFSPKAEVFTSGPLNTVLAEGRTCTCGTWVRYKLQPEHSFLREICRKRQKGLLIFKIWIVSPLWAGGCKRHQETCKFGRVHIYTDTQTHTNFSWLLVSLIPNREDRRLFHLAELGRLQQQEDQQFPRIFLHSERYHHGKAFWPQSTLGIYTGLL